MEKYKKLFSNTAVFGISTVLSKFILSLLLPLYTRFLSTAQYGTAELVTSISQLLIPICSFAIQESVFRFGMDTSYKHEDVLKSSSIASAIGTVGLLICSVLLTFYKPVSDWQWYFFFISAFTMVRTQLSLYVKAIDKTTVFAIDNVIYNLALGVLNVILLVFSKMQLSGYFLAMIIANGISIIYLVVAGNLWSDFRCGNANKQLFKKMLLYSAPLILNSISWGITHLTDKIMLTSFCSNDATGLYSAASKVPSVLSLVTGVFCQAWTLSAIKDYQEDRDKKFYENIFFITHFGVIFVCLFVFMMNNNILLWIIGKNFAESVRYVPVLLIATVFLTYANFYTPIYSAAKKSKQLMYSSFGGMIINVIFNAVLIPKIGIMGACIATALSYTFIAVYRAIDSQKYMKFNNQMLKWATSLLAACIVGVLTVFGRYEILFAGVSMIILMIVYRKQLKYLLSKVINRN